ncbi:MAG TPA: tetratricopeptide repeat protein [Caulobacteraceae bacterium]|jgi:hypothetical protein|nr:tetratricopeptide repeat protein [Caulobacteraceae bacterium]
MFGLPLPLLVLSVGFSIGLCFHAVRTGQDTFWLWIILMFQPIGGLAYLAIIVVPALFRGRGARTVAKGAREVLDPHRDYREAKAAADDSPTVHNRMRLAAAASELGRHDEAEALYREAAQGVHAQDPALQLGRARALVELGRHGEALALLEVVEREGEATAPVSLIMARAYEGLQRVDEADRAYRIAVERIPGLEAIARQAAFLRSVGRSGEAAELVAEIDRRAARTIGPFRKEARAWRELAARG